MLYVQKLLIVIKVIKYKPWGELSVIFKNWKFLQQNYICIYNIENINVNNSKYQSKLIAAQNSSKMYKNFMNSKPAQISDSVS